jgi:glutamine synthetase
MEARSERSATPSATEVAESLERQGVSAVALGFVDPAAIVRVKCVPLARYVDAATRGVGLSTLFNVATSNDQFAMLPGYIDGPSGDLRLRADPAATVPIAAMPGWAWAAVDQWDQDGSRFPGCPRAFLRRMVDGVVDRGYRVIGAFELEFSLGFDRDDGEFHPAHRGPGYSDIALVDNHTFALELIQAMEAQGLQVEQFHPEYADGQFELSIAPRDPIEAADATVLVRQLVRAVALRHGRRASFSPQVADGTGNGTHLHLSLWDGDRNLLAGGDGPAGLTGPGESFLAGILRELPAITAISAPTVLSYHRLQPHHWSGAMQCWGTDNREAALRFVAGPKGASSSVANAEIKPIDGTSNPYLVFGAILAAGLDGIRIDERLPPSTEEDPAGLPAPVREARGVRQLPASLPEAIERLSGSTVLPEAMGGFLFETFLATRRREHEQYADLDEEEVIRRLRWRF